MTRLQTYERRAPFATAVPGLIWISLLSLSCSTPTKIPAKQNRAPSIAQVRDGLSTDINRQQSHTSLAANWDTFVDPEGEVVTYEWSVGTRPGLAKANLDQPLT